MGINVTKLKDAIEFRINLTECALQDTVFKLDTTKYPEYAVLFGLEMFKKECHDMFEKYLFMPANNATEQVMREEIESRFYDYIYWANVERKEYNLSLTYEGYMAYKHNNEIEDALNTLDGTINTVL